MERTTLKNCDKTQEEINNVLERYKEGEVSTGKAAELLELYYGEFLKLLKKENVKARFGPKNLEEAKKEIETIKDMREDF